MKKSNKKIVLYFHNDPLCNDLSEKIKERRKEFLIQIVKKLPLINSEWSKRRFLKNLENIYHKSDKLD